MKYIISCKYLLILIVFLLQSQVLAKQTNKVIILEHADSLVGMILNGEEARQLIGNVKFTQDKMVVTCKKAIQYLKSNKVELEGEVEARNDTVRMVCERGVYYGDKRMLEAFDKVWLEDGLTNLKAVYGQYFVDEKKAFFKVNVIVEDTVSILKCDELTYYRDIQKSVAVGNVRIVNRNNDVIVKGHHFEHYRKNKYSIITGSPQVIQIDSVSNNRVDTLFVSSCLMESFQDSTQCLIAKDSVEIIRGSLASEAGYCIYYMDLDSIILRKSPIVWYYPKKYDEHQLTGDSIFFKLQCRKLQTVYVQGNAIAISRGDSIYSNRFNQLTGQEIILRFQDDKLQSIEVIQTATSLFYLFDDGKPNGANKTTGDYIRFTFRDGTLDKINVTGGVEGQYFPEKMIRNKENEYNLEGFNWRISKLSERLNSKSE